LDAFEEIPYPQEDLASDSDTTLIYI
jgi:hypothetical protein